ncbi:MAG TPA: hypothetical protein PL180_09640 [Spirochaetota bacterium]|nr:hypothetical protein [Spirochaetota bacterium]
MRRVLSIFFALTVASAFLLGGCKKTEDNNTALLLAALSGRDIYSGSNPEGHFVEVSIDRINKKIDFTDYTDSANNLSDLDYTWLDPGNALSDPDPGGFSILYRVNLPAPSGAYALCAEIPGVAVVIAPLDSTGDMLEPPTFAFKRKNVAQSRYYQKAFNWLHVTIDDEDSKPDVMCGFVASDSAGLPTPNGLLYGAEYSIQDDETTDINPDDLAVGNLVQDEVSRAFVGWLADVGDWSNAIVLIGDPDAAMQIIYGENQGSGGAFAIPQASAKEFQAAYAGTYAAIVFQYDKDEMEESSYPVTVEFTAAGNIKVFNFGDDTSSALPLMDSPLTPLEDFDSGTQINDLNTESHLNLATYDGIKRAYQSHGAFIAQGSIEGNPVIVTVLFDPQGRFAGFHLYNDDGNDGNVLNDILSFGLAIKDAKFSN